MGAGDFAVIGTGEVPTGNFPERSEFEIAYEVSRQAIRDAGIDFFASRYGGITQHEMFFDIHKADAALLKTVSDLGMIDAQGLSYAGMGRVFQLLFPSVPVIPGVDGAADDCQFQFVERSVMGPDEYSRIAEKGPFKFMVSKLWATHPDFRSWFGVWRGLSGLGADSVRIKRATKSLQRETGMASLVGPNLAFTPLEWISITLRSCQDFMLDLFRHPDELMEGSRAFMGFLQHIGLGLAKVSGNPRVFLGGNRTSATFLSPKQFEKFALAEWVEMCTYFVRHGITPILHMDSEWTPFFKYFKHLPARKCILNPDGTSDIFKAKEVLGDHMCIMGDVPATLLKLGEPEEVDEYCRRLIEEVGAGGGFILGSGCTVPVDAKPENVKAMIASVRRYKP